MTLRLRSDVIAALAAHYSRALNGKVWAGYDNSRRKYYIRGEGLPASPELQHVYPNGWGLFDEFSPTEARKRVDR